jgi:hypothetical protein
MELKNFSKILFGKKENKKGKYLGFEYEKKSEMVKIFLPDYNDKKTGGEIFREEFFYN